MERDDIAEAVVARLRQWHERGTPSGTLATWLGRLGYRADPSDVEILVSRYVQESDAAAAANESPGAPTRR